MSGDEKLTVLTPRQLQILDLLDRGAPLKLISAELEISQTRVNQLVRELKERLGAQSKFPMVQIYRESSGVRPFYTRDAYPESALSVDVPSPNLADGAAAGMFAFSDVQGFPIEAPWQGLAEPTVVLGMLEGAHAKSRRLIAMVLMSIAIAIAITFALVAAMTVTELWSGVAAIPDVTPAPAVEHRSGGD